MRQFGEIETNIPKSALASNHSEKERVQLMADSWNKSEGELHLDDGYLCDKCRNKGYIVTIEEYRGHWQEKLLPCSCIKPRKMIAKLNRSGLKGAVKKYAFENFATDDLWQATILQAAQQYAASPQGWFFIGGQSGAGKTHLCTAISVQLLRQSMEVRYMLWRDEAASIKSIITESADYQKRVDELKKCEVLYIDDLFKAGKGGITAADINLAFEILNFRYINEKPTIISTELTMQEILNIDEATAGRVAERAGNNCFTIRKDGSKNWRTKGIKEL